jgi:hypothetical protein
MKNMTITAAKQTELAKAKQTELAKFCALQQFICTIHETRPSVRI